MADTTRDGASPAGDLWRIHGRAYDLSEWLPQHPGGARLLQLTRGVDCTELFESYHAASLKETYIRTTLNRYRVGGEEPSTPSPTPVYDDMKREVRAYRRAHGIKATDARAFVAWYAVLFVLYVVSSCVWVQGNAPYAWMAVFTVTLMLWGASVLHDGWHYSITTSVWWNECLATYAIGFFPVLPATWLRQHVVGHHVHTNVRGRDPDLYHHKPWWRYASRQRWNDRYRAWWVVWPLVTTLTFVAPFVLRLGLGPTGRWAGTPASARWAPGERRRARLRWWATLAFYGAVALRGGVLYALAPFLGAGAHYYLASQVSHINHASLLETDENLTDEPKEWPVRQILAAQGDYSYESLFWSAVSFGLNNQALHHCFPSVHWCHYPALSRRLKPVFQKHGLPRSGWSQSFGDSLRLHLQQLKTVNARSPPS